MIYECDNCEATLGPGLTACPHCGEVFDEPVPADAIWDEPAPALLDARTSPRLPNRRKRRWALSLAAALLLSALGWLGYRQRPVPARPPVPVAVSRLPSDLAAHPQYQAHMTDFVQQLRAAGVGAEWPAFGSTDILLVTPQARAAESPVVWDTDTYQRLAQGIYGHFVQTRHECGFADADAMNCFVLVSSASGQVVAVDFMGELK